MENLQLSRPYFNTLARKMGNRQFPNDETLLKHLFNTPGTVAVFVELHKWLPYSKRADGSIYKSDAQLAHATNRSAKTVERSRKILREAGFTIEIKKANGAPTNHYRFDLDAFITFAAKKLNIKIEQLREWMLSAAEKLGKKSVSDTMSKSTDAAVQKVELVSDTESKSAASLSQNETRPIVELDFDKTAVSLTTNEITEKTDRKESNIETATTPYTSSYYKDEAVVVDSSSLKMEIHSIAAMLKVNHTLVEGWIVKHGLDRVKAVAKRAVEDPKVRNSGGWAKLAIENNYQWAEKVPTVPTSMKYTDGPYAAFIRS